MSACRSCGAEVVWVKTSNGVRPFPVDVSPAPNGNIRLHTAEVATVYGKDAAVVLREAGVELHLAHHVTCKHGEHWKGGGGALQQTLDGKEVPTGAVAAEAEEDEWD